MKKYVLICFCLFVTLRANSQARCYISAAAQPWNSSSNINALNASFGSGNWSQYNYSSANMTAILQPTTCLIFIEGGDQTSTAFNAFLTPNLTALQNWVAGGGRLFINAAPNQGGNINYGFGGVTLNYSGSGTSSNSGIAALGQTGHPVFTGSNTPCGTSFTGNWFSHAYITGGGTSPIIVGSTGVSLSELNWGSGLVMFGGMTTTNFHSPQPNSNNLLNNIFSYLYICCPITASASPSSVCLGSGSALSAYGSSGSTFTWQPGNVPSPSIAVNPLGNSVYTVIGTNSLGCVNSTTVGVTITPPCISVSSTSITCSNLGTATVVSNGGIGPFSYTWMPTGQTSSVATGLTPGTYTLTVFDFGNNFSYTATTVFNSLIPLTGNLNNSSNISCFGAATGTANVTSIAGGSGAQNYLWFNSSTSYTTPFVNTLSAGVWSVAVTDALTGCQIFQTFFISQPPAMNLTMSSNSPTGCAGTSIGLSGVNSGGTPHLLGPGYTYTWTGGPAAASNTVSQALAGTYIYTLSSKDSLNCLISNTLSLDFIPNPTLSIANTSICPLTVGTLTALGATSYTWANSTTGATFTNNPLSSSSYSVIGSTLGCTASASGSIVLLPLPSAFFSSNSPVCNGQNLQLNGSGGASYAWAGPLGFTSNIINPTVNTATTTNSGVYNLTVTGVNNCTASVNHTLTVNPTPTVSAFGSIVCVTQTLNLSSFSFPGSSFNWTGPNSFTSGQQNPFLVNPTLQASGDYTVKATSAVGCTNTAVASVTVVALPQPVITSNSPRCFGENLILNGSGGLSYSWSGPNSFNSTVSNPTLTSVTLPADGIYTLAVTVGPCVASITKSVTIYPLPTPTASNTGPVCEKKQLQLLVNYSGVSYLWLGPNIFSAFAQNPAPIDSVKLSQSGIYTVTVTDNNGCKASSTTTVSILPNPIVTASGATVCLNAEAIISASGAVNYLWSGPGFYFSNKANAFIASANNPAATFYTVVGTAANTCTDAATVNLITLSLPTPSLTVSPKAKVCLTETISLEGFGGNSYEWHGPGKALYPNKLLNLTLSNLNYAGEYTLIVTDAKGCSNSTVTTISIDNLPNGSLTGTNMQSCIPFRSDFSFYSSASNSLQVTTKWELDNHLFTTKKFSYPFSHAGDYVITGWFTDTVTKCSNTATFSVNAYPLPVADFTYFPQNPVENMDEVLLTNTSKGENQSKWDWFFNSNNGYHPSKESVSYLFSEEGKYPVALVIKNSWGCMDTVIKVISVEPDFNVYIPNAFSPNGDGINDTFLPILRGTKSYLLAIFNRWGNKIFETTDLNSGWDGSFQG